MNDKDKTLFRIIKELELIIENDARYKRNNLETVLNFCRDINGVEENG